MEKNYATRKQLEDKALDDIIDKYLEEKGYTGLTYRRVGRHEERLGRIEQMLKWLVKFNLANQPEFIAHIKKKLPDISDIV